MSLVNIGPFREKSVPAALQVTFTDSAGTALNITSMTVKFVYKPVNGADGDETERTGSVVDGSSGIAKYVWVEADTTTAGSYRGVMWAYDADEQYASDEYCWIVQAGLVPSTI